MEDLKKAIARCEAKLYRLKEEAATQEKINSVKEAAFEKRYDEVLNKYILSFFRKPAEELNGNHEHRAVKIINGDIVHLRLDFLHGQADGIKVLFARSNITMYIWFSPQISSQKIVFKLVSARKGINASCRYNLDEIHESFLPGLIGEKLREVI